VVEHVRRVDDIESGWNTIDNIREEWHMGPGMSTPECGMAGTIGIAMLQNVAEGYGIAVYVSDDSL
jgi:hypothetical protein